MPNTPSATFTRRRALGLALGTPWAVTRAAPAAAPAADAPATFDAWAEAYAADWVRLSAERATYTQYFSGAEQAAFERELTPQTPAKRERQRALARDGLARLAAFEAGALSAEQRTEAATLRWSLPSGSHGNGLAAGTSP